MVNKILRVSLSQSNFFNNPESSFRCWKQKVNFEMDLGNEKKKSLIPDSYLVTHRNSHWTWRLDSRIYFLNFNTRLFRIASMHQLPRVTPLMVPRVQQASQVSDDDNDVEEIIQPRQSNRWVWQFCHLFDFLFLFGIIKKNL